MFAMPWLTCHNVIEQTKQLLVIGGLHFVVSVVRRGGETNRDALGFQMLEQRFRSCRGCCELVQTLVILVEELLL